MTDAWRTHVPKAPGRHIREPVVSLDPAEQAEVDAKLRAAALRDAAEQNGGEQADAQISLEEPESKYDDDELLKTKTPLLTGSDPAAKREEIRDYFHRTFTLYERLFDVLASDETYQLQPEKLRHPLIFYAGHTAVFFINKLRLAGLLSGRINESMESTLAIGVDEYSWDDLNVGSHVWPTAQQVRDYRDMARQVVDDLVSSLPLTLPITWKSPFWIILMGCEHERIHLETSSVLFRQLPLAEVKPVPMWSACTQFRERAEDVPSNTLLPVPGGVISAGNSEQTQRVYGWDLEYGTHTATVGPFDAARFLCTNAEFLEFVQDGGYDDASLWGEEGARFIAFRKATCPVFWVPIPQSAEVVVEDTDAPIAPSPPSQQQQFRYRTMTSEIPMPMDWPVDVNYIEAKAFCEWKNRRRRAAEGDEANDGRVYRLLSEDEYFRLRDHAFPASTSDDEGVSRLTDQPDWAVAPGNINLEHGASSCPVDRYPFEHGFHDIVGNVWQWTETPLLPFKGFKPHPAYDDFSLPTFDTRHNVIVGGSWISTGNEATRTARFAFRRHFYQHAGFRYILAPPLSESESKKTQTQCETDEAVVAMLDAQFNDLAQAKLAVAMRMQPSTNYAEQIARIANDVYRTHGSTGTETPADDPLSREPTSLSSPGARAMDIGCACGRSTFELAKLAAPGVGSPGSIASPSSATAPLFNHILGLDLSTRFIRIAAQLQFEGHAEYAMRKEGSLLSYHSIESVADAPRPSVSSATVSAVDSSVSSDPSVLDLDLHRIGMQHRVEFMQGDACNLASKYTNFDLVIASSLLEFLYAPKAFLQSIGSRIRPGGILLLASTYEWDEKYTPKDQRLGGMKDAGGESVDSARAVGAILQEAGTFVPLPAFTQDIPMIWKQNQRNYSLRFAHVTAWKRK